MKNKAFVIIVALVPALLLLALACGGEGKNPFGVESESVALADEPFALAFAPDGRLFFVERLKGDVRVITAEGQLLPEPFAHVDVLGGVEWGLTGLAIDPEFESNHYVYVFFSQPARLEGADQPKPVLTRFTADGNRGVDPKVIMDDFPISPAQYSVNGSIHFGPDGFLYMTVGDYDLSLVERPGRKPYSQDLTSPLGKMLRVDRDGAPAPDNPFVDDPDADPRIFAYGLRDNFDFAIHPETRQIYGRDSTPFSCEELNLIEPGGNYGWPFGKFPFPDCEGGKGAEAIYRFAQEGMEPGDFLSSTGVSGSEFASGDVYPLLGDSLLVCEGLMGQLRRLVLTGTKLDRVTDDDVVVSDCGFDVTVSPDGVIYYGNETEIRRLVPLPVETP